MIKRMKQLLALCILMSASFAAAAYIYKDKNGDWWECIGEGATFKCWPLDHMPPDINP